MPLKNRIPEFRRQAATDGNGLGLVDIRQTVANVQEKSMTGKCRVTDVRASLPEPAVLIEVDSDRPPERIKERQTDGELVDDVVGAFMPAPVADSLRCLHDSRCEGIDHKFKPVIGVTHFAAQRERGDSESGQVDPGVVVVVVEAERVLPVQPPQAIGDENWNE